MREIQTEEFRAYRVIGWKVDVLGPGGFRVCLLGGGGGWWGLAQGSKKQGSSKTKPYAIRGSIKKPAIMEIGPQNHNKDALLGTYS